MKIKKAAFMMFLLFADCLALADKSIACRGQATRDGRDLYTEKIETRLSDHGDLLRTSTHYMDPHGKLLASLEADFSSGLNVPNHRFHDERSGYTFGVRRASEKIVMYAQPKDKPEKTRELEKGFKSDRLMFAGPGLAPYLKTHIDEFRKKGRVSILLLIPGNLDTFNFEIVLNKEKVDGSEFDVNISSIFLKLFAPKIQITYNSGSQMVTHYEGVSNVNDSSDKTQSVKIDYVCPNEPLKTNKEEN